MVDIIYTDKNRVDVGIVPNPQLDLAFGSSENDFELVVDKSKHCCSAGSLIYVEGTEYGGIVDGIEAGTDSNEIKYLGRSWHGVLESKCLEPPEGQNYLRFYGDANKVLGEIITLLDLSELFEAESTAAGIKITAYKPERYSMGYTAILKMLSSVGAKLKMVFNGEKVKLWAEPVTDYANNDDSATQFADLTVKQYQNSCNHLICLGKGELKDRAVIHLFTDKNGGVRPYKKVADPVKDSQYILDCSKQVLKGIYEITQVYDNANAEITENFVLLTSQPSDWKKKFSSYYILDDNDEFKELEGVSNDVITTLKTKPSDWETNFTAYYIDALTNKTVEGVETSKYQLLSKKPVNWDVSYSSYYEYFNNGTSVQYNAVSGVSYDKYDMQTAQPTDWKDNFKSYYCKSGTRYTEVAALAPQWVRNKFYSKSGNSYTLLNYKPNDWSTGYGNYYCKSGSSYVKTEGVAPSWSRKRYYTKSSVTKPPMFVSGKYYKKVSSVTSAPPFVANKYQSKTEKMTAPSFCKNKYYKKELDRYKVLVENGIEKLKEIKGTESLDIDLEQEVEYDIGDLVGGTEPKTNISAVETINKKIVKIENGRMTVTHETGVLE